MSQNYAECKTVDWEKIKIPKIINISILILIVIGVFVGQYCVPLIELLKLIKAVPLLLLVVPLVILLYIVLHELIHGILMKHFSGISPQYGFSGPFIFAKSEAVFNKNSYILITLAPMLILGMISVVLSFILSGVGIWLPIFVWIINLFASRGDIQAVILLKGLPHSYGIKDDGDSLQIYKPVK